MKNQILSLVFFMLTTTLMVVQGESKKSETVNQTEINDLVNVAKTDISQENLSTIY